MIDLKVQDDYVVCDTQEWLGDRCAMSRETAQDAYDAWREANPELYYESDAVIAWLETLHDDSAYEQTEWQTDDNGDRHEVTTGWSSDLTPQGLYHDGPPFRAASINEDNYLDQDIMVMLAHTAEYGSLLIWQYGYFTMGTVYVRPFTGDDDADAYSWSGGSAGHIDGSECDQDYILESACRLWPNGGGSKSYKLWELEQGKDSEGEDTLLCPVHHVPLGFIGY